MKTYSMLWTALALLIFSATADAFNIKIYPDHQRFFIAHGTTRNVIAQSVVLGDGAKSIAVGTWNATLGAWVIPTANKDDRVYYSIKDSAGVLHWLDTCPGNITATSGHVDITNVIENADCTISYRYKGFAKTTPKVSFSNGFLSGDMGTNVFYAIQNAHLKLNQMSKVEWNSDRCGWANNSACTIAPALNARGNIVFRIDTVSNDFGTVSVKKAGTPVARYWFNLGSWTNGTGVTKVGSDRLQLGTARQGVISYTGTTTKTLEVNMGYDWLPTVPFNITNIKGFVTSDRLGWDYIKADTNAYNNGIGVGMTTDVNGSKRFVFANAMFNDELPVSDLVKNDDLSLVVTGMDGTTPKTYFLPIADFTQGSGVTLDTVNNRIKYGGYIKPSITVNATAHTMRVALNADMLMPVSIGTVAPKRSVAQNIQFFSATTGIAYTGIIQKNASGYFFANIGSLPATDCGFIAIALTGGTKDWAYDYNEDASKSIWTLVGATKSGTINTNGNGDKFCF